MFKLLQTNCFDTVLFLSSHSAWHELVLSLSRFASEAELNDTEKWIVNAELAVANLLVIPEEKKLPFHFTTPQNLWVPEQTPIHPPVVTREQLIYWKQRSKEEDNAFLRARYSDVIWDLGRFSGAEANRDQESAYSAVTAYIESYNLVKLHNPILGLGSLERGLNLSAQLGSDSLISKASTAALAVFVELPPSGFSGIWLAIAKLLSESRVYRRNTLERLTAAFTKRFYDAVAARDKLTADLAIDLQLKLLSKKPAEQRRALSAYADMHSEIAKTDTPLVALSALLYVVHRLETPSMNEKAEQLRFQAEQLSPAVEAGMHESSYTHQVQTADIDRYFDKLFQVDDRFIALYRVAKHTLPKVKKIREELKDLQARYPIQFLVTRVSFGHSGLPVTETRGMHEPDKHFSRHYTDSLNLNSIQFKWGLDRLLKRFTMAPEDICGWLQSSLLVSNTRMPLIEAGVKAHFSGDFFKALHILVPQIEEMLRQLLRLFEISRSKSVRGQTGATELKNISDILRIPRIVEALDEDLYMFLLHLLVSKPGFNLRNDLAHGIAPVESFNELTSGLILQCVILLGAIRDEATVLDMSAS